MKTSTIKLSVKQWAEEDRPSTKLLNLGANTLTNAELISILVGSGTTQHNAVEIAQAILSKYDCDLSKLGKADFHELKEIDGVVSVLMDTSTSVSLMPPRCLQRPIVWVV